ncbi:trypsin-like peptidase domain-containing protein [Kitasatospora sp. LaBMicrA B282]|uniref:nSTAND1 domain-containing NTPase n=1 Tax=Kitasatospora sp. LaBMicrA B282 TaxID=3420949 RepID=UPI003D126ECE
MTGAVPDGIPGAGPGAVGGAKALDAAVLRIRDRLENPVGLGFLVTPELALTCAHVVEAALAGQGVEPGVGSAVFVDLPLQPSPRGQARASSAGVAAVVEVWDRRQPDGGGDVAVLRLSSMLPGARPVRLIEAGEVWQHPARAFGFPLGHDGGVWHSGVLRARQANGWVQADLAATGHRVSRGFSGGPVWDDQLVGVVGMMVAAEAGQPPVSYLIPTDGLLAAWPVLRDLALPPSPFRSLMPFAEADAHVFHGRRAESAEVAARLGRERWVTVVGPSGSGKSSLALAGVVPRLRAGGSLVLTVRPANGSSPLSALAAGLLALLEPELPETHRLTELPLLTSLLADPDGLADLVPRLLARHNCSRLLLVVDQFEELLGAGPGDVDRLAEVLYHEQLPETVRVLTTLRADFLAAVLDHPRLGPAIRREVYALGPMSPEQLREVVTAPIEAVPGVTYQANLAERLLAETGSGPGALPLLGFTLDQLWHRQHGGLLTHQAYDDLGGVRGALGAHADEIWQTCVAPADEAPARRLFTQLVRVPLEAASATRRCALRTDLGAAEWRIAQDLAATRLLVTGRNAEGVETVELAHEALITAWQRLRGWAEQDRSFLAWREVLRHDLERWQLGGQTTDLLPTRSALAGAQPWLSTGSGLLNAAERDYLRRGRRHRRARARRVRAVIAVLCVLALAAATGLVLTVRQQHDTARQAAIVRSKSLAADAAALRSTDPGLASRLAIAAYRSSPTPEAADQLYGVLGSMLDSVVGDTGSQILRIATAVHSPLVAASATDNSVRIWSLADPAAPVLDAAIHSSAAAVALNPSGSLLAAACDAGDNPGLCLWDLADPRHPIVAGRLPRPAGGPDRPRQTVPSMAITPDGGVLAAGLGDGETVLWSITDPSAPRLLADLPNPTTPGSAGLTAVAFAPRGNLLATTALGATTQLWQVGDPAHPQHTATIAGSFQAIAFSPDGGLLGAASDSQVGLWRLGDPTQPTAISVNTPGLQTLQSLAFSPDGGQLAYSGMDTISPPSSVCLMDLSPGNLDQQPGPSMKCSPEASGAFAMAYTPSGGLLTGGDDGILRQWRHPLLPQLDAQVEDSGPNWSLSANGRFLAAPQSSGQLSQDPQSVGIWDLSTADQPVLEATLPVSAMGASSFFATPRWSP